MSGWSVGRAPRGGVILGGGGGGGGVDPAFEAGWGNGGMPVYRNEFNTSADMLDMNIRNNFLTFDQARAMAANVSLSGASQMLMKAEWYNPVQSGGPSIYNGGRLTHSTSYVDWRNNTSGIVGAPKTFSQEYGMWVWKAGPVPSGNHTLGVLTALWLRNDNTLGEIDVMECYGYESALGTTAPMTSTYNTYIKESAIFTFHSNTNKAATPKTGGGSIPYKKAFWRNWEHGVPKFTHSTKSVIHKFERMPTYMRYTVDGIQVFYITPSSTDPTNGVGSSVNPSGDMSWAWDPDLYGGPMHVRMNIHVGTSPTSYGVADPTHMEYTQNIVFPVDYLRIYAP